MILTMIILFWVSVGTIIYAYVGFTALVVVVGWLLNRKVKKAPITPSVTLLIAAYNEEKNISEKVKNSLALNYPKDKLEIMVASDGSSDRTHEIVSQYEDQGVKLLRFERRGKIFALNDSIAQATGEIIVFSDANTFYDEDSLLKLVENFADPAVGGVCGNQCHFKNKTRDNAGQGESLYWNYDKALKQFQNQTGSIVSADGAIYAIRKDLYEMPPSTAVTDDFAISTGVIEKGHRLVFENDALAYENTMPGAEEEFRRKVRIMNRGLRGVIMRKKLLNPFRYGFYSVTLFSHKVLRRLVPFFLIFLYIASLFLVNTHIFYTTAAIAQTVFYLWAGISYLMRQSNIGGSKLFYIPFFYCMANLAAFIAVLNIIAGRKIEFWNPQRQKA